MEQKMADTIQIKAGSRETLPELLDREPGFCTDSKELFIGGADGNTLVASGAAAAGEFEEVSVEFGLSANSVDAKVISGQRGIYVELEGGLVQGELLALTEQCEEAEAPNGALFEGADGVLRYKSLAGNVTELTTA